MWYEKELKYDSAEIGNDYALIPRHFLTQGHRFFLKIWLKYRKQSDRKYIAWARRRVIEWKRIRFWVILFHVVMLALALAIVPMGLQNVIGLIDPQNVSFAWCGFLLGAIFGWAIAWFFFKLINSLVTYLFMYRAEKLMLKYHDAIREAVALEKNKDSGTAFDFKDL